MLHSVVKERVCFWILLAVLLSAAPSCKRDTAVRSEEEEIFFTDYDSPPDKWGYIDTQGQLVIKPIFDDVGFFAGGLACANLAGRWGYIDRAGEFIVQPAFKSAWAFHEGIARVSPFNGMDQYITRSGKTIAGQDWSAADDFSEGLAKVKVGNSYGFIDTSGKLVLPAIYTRCWSFKHGLAVVSLDEKLGVINTNGEILLPTQFDKIKIVEANQLILANTQTSSIIYDLNGVEKISLNDAKAIDSDGQVVVIQKGDLMFFLDLTDGTILPGSGWSNVIYLGEQRWAGKNKYGFFLLKSNGTKLGLKPFAQINRLVDGIAAFYNGKNWGYIDAQGKELTPDIFGLAWDFKEGFARAAFPDGIAFLNRKMELALFPPPGTIDMRDFAEGLAPVQIVNQ